MVTLQTHLLPFRDDRRWGSRMQQIFLCCGFALTAKVRYVKDVQPLHHKAFLGLKENLNPA